MDIVLPANVIAARIELKKILSKPIKPVVEDRMDRMEAVVENLQISVEANKTRISALEDKINSIDNVEGIGPVLKTRIKQYIES